MNYLELLTAIYSDDPNVLVLKGIADINPQMKLIKNYPDELNKFYAQCGGVYRKISDDEPSGSWIIPKPDNLMSFSEEHCWFSATHSELARRYMVIMYLDGDSIGYLTNRNKEPDKSVYLFRHEDYAFEENQNHTEFLIKLNLDFLGYLRKAFSRKS